MPSKWIDLKETALSLRRQGQSIKAINRNLGIPISTLSGWLRNIELTPAQKEALAQNQARSLGGARLRAIEWHHTQKALRLLDAKRSAEKTLSNIELTDELLDLAFAMLYLGEGTKTDNETVIASSDPKILQFALVVLKRNYNIGADQVRCELHLRLDQDGEALKKYWSDTLAIPLSRFKYVAYDKRSAGKATYDHYKGVCVLGCGNVAIQRKLVYLYKLFCDQVINLGG